MKSLDRSNTNLKERHAYIATRRYKPVNIIHISKYSRERSILADKHDELSRLGSFLFPRCFPFPLLERYKKKKVREEELYGRRVSTKFVIPKERSFLSLLLLVAFVCIARDATQDLRPISRALT